MPPLLAAGMMSTSRPCRTRCPPSVYYEALLLKAGTMQSLCRCCLHSTACGEGYAETFAVLATALALALS